MIIGVPKEIKDNEARVGVTPAGVKALAEAGHHVLVETQAGRLSGFDDATGCYRRATGRQRKIARRWLGSFGLAGCAGRSFGSLSAGLQRMTLLARALVKRPDLLVLDEAHAVESSATDFFSSELTRFSVNKRLSRLTRRRGSRSFGLMPRLLELKLFPAEALAKLPDAIGDARRAMDDLDNKAARLFEASRPVRLRRGRSAASGSPR